jgi:hypothetical protein
MELGNEVFHHGSEIAKDVYDASTIAKKNEAPDLASNMRALARVLEEAGVNNYADLAGRLGV